MSKPQPLTPTVAYHLLQKMLVHSHEKCPHFDVDTGLFLLEKLKPGAEVNNAAATVDSPDESPGQAADPGQRLYPG